MNKVFEKNLISWRHELFNMPELSYQEFKTQAFIIKTLEELGLCPRIVAGTGVIADIVFSKNKNGKEKCIAFRADIDALPFETDEAVLSNRYQAFHACGHDMHASILLGLAYKLQKSDYKQKLSGRVRLIFQPAEEILQKNSGSHQMVKEGVLENPQVEKIYALHVTPRYKVGEIAYHNGNFMSECFRVKLEISGRAGHGVNSNISINPILISSKIILKLHDFFSSIKDDHSILSFCKINGGFAINTLPKTIVVEGTLRALNADRAKKLANQLNEFLINMKDSFNSSDISLTFEPTYSALVNSSLLNSNLISSLKKVVGNNIYDCGSILASEDFSEYTKKIPGAMFLLGVNENNLGSAPVHSIDFKGSDNALTVGVNCFEQITITELKRD